MAAATAEEGAAEAEADSQADAKDAAFTDGTPSTIDTRVPAVS